MKFVAFLRASAKEISFCLAWEHLNHSLIQDRKEVYVIPCSKSGIRTASWWNHFTNSARDSYRSCLIFDR